MISGFIRLKDNTQITISDANIISSSLSVQMSVCRDSSFQLGTFNASTMKIGILDETALGHDFADAKIALKTTISGQEIKLGEFYVDGDKTKRYKSKVLLTAYDGSTVFDAELSDTIRAAEYNSAYDALLAVCTAVGISMITTSSELANFPNYNVHIAPASAAIQTYRDLVMWICQLLAAHAVLNRAGALEIRHARRNAGIDPIDITVLASQRTDIEFSDGRAYVKYMTAYSGGKVKTYRNNHVFSDPQVVPATLALPWNPLMENMTESDCDTINLAILYDIRLFLQRQITAKLFDDPTVALDKSIEFYGGKVDVRTAINGLITSITWRYHGSTVVTCAAMPAVKDDADEQAEP